MTTVNKTLRLLAAAKEFNIGKETLIEFLAGKGFEVSTNPNAKITEQMYDALQAEFAQDRAAKQKSEQIALPKALANEKASKEPSKPAFKKEIITLEELDLDDKSAKSTTPDASQEATTSAPEAPVASKEEADQTVKEEKTPKAEDKPIETQPVDDAPAPSPTATEEATSDDNASSVGSIKVVGKISLDDINHSTRPKKGTKKKEAPKTTAAETVEKSTEKAEKPKDKDKDKTKSEKKKAEATSTDNNKAATTPSKKEERAPATASKEPPAVEQAPVVNAPVEDHKPEHIEMNSPKLAGPKILGKIELPVDNSDKKNANNKEKRKRKRIPLDKKPENNKTQEGNNQQGNQNNNGPKRPGQGGNDRRGGFQDRRQGGGAGQNRRNDHRRADQVPAEIDEKAIQKKIQETQAKLAGASKNKHQKTKYRRDKREHMAEKRAAESQNLDGNKIQVTEFISVSELANLLDVNFTDVISKCMGLGIMVSINQRLDAEVIELVSNEFGYEVEFINLQENEDQEVEEVDAEDDLIPRAPIVTIMGHVDHGKTSLLDYIRDANVVAGEAGGITQHIGAYRVTTKEGKNLTFLDTPGHEAFTAMRARGAKVADVAVIVVAADDAIMPQTKEAISHAQAAGLPMVFAINKIDKEGANPEKIKEQLAQMNILVEDWGGKFQSQEISAKHGLNIDLLLEKILLEVELLELKANPNREASGTVIEASLDKGRGFVATILVQNGTLNQGDMIVSGQHYGKIKAMFNERGLKVKSAGPTVPVQILGLNGAPQAGERFKVYEDDVEAKNVANHRSQILREQGIRVRKHLTLDEIGRRLALGNFKELPIIIKGDFDGSVEALSDSLQKLSTEEVAVNIVHKGVGQITESDVNLATASDAIIIGFQVRPSMQAARLADQENIEIRTYSIIYDAIEEVKSAMEGLLEPKVERKTVCHIEIRETFKISGVGVIAGSYVTDGKVTRQTKINIIRDGIVIHTGELASLKRFKDDVKEVNAGYECGLSVKNYNDLQVGDILEGFEEVEVKRKL